MTSSSSELSDTDVSDQYSSESCSEEPEAFDAEMDGSNLKSCLLKPVGCVAARKEKVKARRVPGVVYLSRIPPCMKPHKLKHLLSPYGGIGRVFLQPEGTTW